MSVSPGRQPSAFLPIAMSIAALMTVLYHIAIFGIARETDEGAAAHVWRLLMVGQLPVVAFYAVKWLPPAPRTALQVLALQLCAAIAALAPVQNLHPSPSSDGRSVSRRHSATCRLKQKLHSATVVILSNWKGRIRLKLSHHTRMSFDL
jgi:hypothetical protein